jgi:diguanylate cyclase (GGDEF)-like protein
MTLRVVMLTQDVDARLRWTEALAGVAEFVPARSAAEVVVVDETAEASVVAQERASSAGLIAVGIELPEADAALPADCLPRELVLACRLVGQVAQLRRQAREADSRQAALRDAAFTDPLTGLPNRRAWDAELSRRIQDAQRSGAVLGVAIVDLDRLKQINEQHGYAAGDEALVAAAQAVRGSLRERDFVARLGGDEFGLLVECRAAEEVAQVVARVCDELPRRTECSPRRLTAAFGSVAAGAAGGNDPAALLAAADASLREAKRAARAGS